MPTHDANGLPLSDLELQRLQNIAGNTARLAALGL
jgi:hypothetical protein